MRLLPYVPIFVFLSELVLNQKNGYLLLEKCEPSFDEIEGTSQIMNLKEFR